MILNWISILFLSIVIGIFLFLIKRANEHFGETTDPVSPSETTDPVFTPDSVIEDRIREYEETEGIIIKKHDKKQQNTEYETRLDEIEQILNNFEKTFNFFTENINNFPVCREIDLRWDLAPRDNAGEWTWGDGQSDYDTFDANQNSGCSARNNNTCEFNPWCTWDNTSKVCNAHPLKQTCKNIMIDVTGNHDDSKHLTQPTNTCTYSLPCIRKKAKQMFLSPEVLNEVKRAN
jgi:hypothetical protein